MKTFMRFILISFLLNSPGYAASPNTGDVCPAGSTKHCSKDYPACCAAQTGITYCAKTAKDCKPIKSS